MLNGIKARILTVPELVGAVELADEVESAIIKKFEPSAVPSVLLFYGPNRYLENDNPARVRQPVDKFAVAMLFCPVAQLDDLEQKVVQACLGYKKNLEWDMPLIAAESSTHKIAGELCIRRISFLLQARVVQSPL